MYLFKKKKVKPHLYMKHKLKINQSLEVTVDANQETENNKQKNKEIRKKQIENRILREKEKELKREKKKLEMEKRKEVHLDVTGKLNIVVCSLTDNNVGCSHVANTFARYFLGEGKSTCIINLSQKKINNLECDEYISKKELLDSNKEYEIIIFDYGNLNKGEIDITDIGIATIKIMMCIYEDEYMKRLAEHVENTNLEWFYIFNYTPKGKYKRIDELMEDYKYFCLPLYSLEDKKQVNEVISNILRGE